MALRVAGSNPNPNPNPNPPPNPTCRQVFAPEDLGNELQQVDEVEPGVPIMHFLWPIRVRTRIKIRARILDGSYRWM